MLNADAPWDAFDPLAYIDHNYRALLEADAEIIHYVRDHFSDHFRENLERPVLGIDVGAGANLYPALSMLPWCDEITLFERSAANVSYLEGQRPSFDREWDSFWSLLCEDPEYRRIDADRRERFRQAVRIEPGDLFALGRPEGPERRVRRWGIGTMFFVAESLSTSRDEFRQAVSSFLRALEPGAPFAAAFMAGSKGYEVGDLHFPACDVGETDVKEAIHPFAPKTEIRHLANVSHVVRPGHTGMILALGHRQR
jgi:hypothetical protein